MPLVPGLTTHQIEARVFLGPVPPPRAGRRDRCHGFVSCRADAAETGGKASHYVDLFSELWGLLLFC